MKKLAIITTHPIQYNAPWFRLLAEKNGIQVKVFYTWSQRQTEFFDDNFGKEIKWDIPLLDGYDYEFVENTSKTPGNKSYWGINCPALNQSIEAWGASHLLVFGWNFMAHFGAMRYFKGKIPVLFRGDSTLLDYDVTTFKAALNYPFKQFVGYAAKSYLRYKIRKQFLSFIYRYVDKALYVGTHNRQYFLAHGLKENQLCFVPHAIDNHRFADSPEKEYGKKAAIWRRELGLAETDIVILYAGKFEPRKNPQILINAFLTLKDAKASQEYSRAKLIMIGNGPLENDLRQLCKNEKDVLFLPFQNQSLMPVVYRLGNYFCLPSQSETWGLVINEAIASGIPVIVSTKVGCATDLANLPPCATFQSGDSTELSVTLKDAFSQNISKFDANWNAYIQNWSFQTLTANILKALD